MPYNYAEERAKLFTDEGQRRLLAVRDNVNRLLDEAGAFEMVRAWSVLGLYNSWEAMSYVDRLVELGEIREISQPGCEGQSRVFVRGRR